MRLKGLKKMTGDINTLGQRHKKTHSFLKKKDWLITIYLADLKNPNPKPVLKKVKKQPDLYHRTPNKGNGGNNDL